MSVDGGPLCLGQSAGAQDFLDNGVLRAAVFGDLCALNARDRTHAHRQIQAPAAAARSWTQITQFGAAPGLPIGDHADEQIGGYSRAYHVVSIPTVMCRPRRGWRAWAAYFLRTTLYQERSCRRWRADMACLTRLGRQPGRLECVADRRISPGAVCAVCRSHRGVWSVGRRAEHAVPVPAYRSCSVGRISSSLTATCRGRVTM
jgi:hypothetical protein